MRRVRIVVFLPPTSINGTPRQAVLLSFDKLELVQWKLFGQQDDSANLMNSPEIICLPPGFNSSASDW
jgi:hypothetical protein